MSRARAGAEGGTRSPVRRRLNGEPPGSHAAGIPPQRGGAPGTPPPSRRPRPLWPGHGRELGRGRAAALRPLRGTAGESRPPDFLRHAAPSPPQPIGGRALAARGYSPRRVITPAGGASFGRCCLGARGGWERGAPVWQLRAILPCRSWARGTGLPGCGRGAGQVRVHTARGPGVGRAARVPEPGGGGCAGFRPLAAHVHRAAVPCCGAASPRCAARPEPGGVCVCVCV